MLEVLYCCECQDNLCEYGECASELFIKICNYFLLFGKPMPANTDIHSSQHGIVEVIRFLEIKCYVVSTEGPGGFIHVKPLGVSCIQEEDNYRICHVCFEREKHA